MSLGFDKGKQIAVVVSGPKKGKKVYIHTDDDNDDGIRDINLGNGKLFPTMDKENRSVNYIAGPAGSGKSTYAVALALTFQKEFPGNDIYIFSRTNHKDDPAYKKLKATQVTLDESILENPIDLDEIESGSLIIFDDCNTIGNKEIKNEIDRLIMDILEVGRKMDINIILTNHLVNPNERKYARTVMNELQNFTFFPQSGSWYQVHYCLKNYFGLDNKQIDEIKHLKSRWVTVMKNYPMAVLHEHGAYLI